MRTVLCFGDSNTHGTIALRQPGERRRFDRAHRWPNVMAAALGHAWEVIAEGHPGRTAVFDDPVDGDHLNGLRILPSLLESHRPIDLVIVMLGTNDLKARFSATTQDITQALERLVKNIGQSDAGVDGVAPQILLAAPVPVQEVGFLGESFEGGAVKSQRLAPKLADVARRHGAGFVDLGAVAEVDMVDGVHLSAEAQRTIGAAMAREVTRLFSE